MLAWLVFLGAILGEPRADAHVLDVPYRNQLDGSAYAMANCGPTSLSMALAYYGVDASPWDLRVRAMQAQQSWVDDEGSYSDHYGVFIYNLASVAETHGVHATGLWRRDGGRLDTLREWQPSELRREIQANHPVIVQVHYRALPRHSRSSVTDDHYVVVHGTIGSDFVYSDPLGTPEGGPNQTISEADLARAMAEAATPRTGFALVQSKR
jgi:uncharacterized protein YvpB